MESEKRQLQNIFLNIFRNARLVWLEYITPIIIKF